MTATRSQSKTLPLGLLLLAVTMLSGCVSSLPTSSSSVDIGAWQEKQVWPLDERVRDVALAEDGSFILLSSMNQTDLRGIQRLDAVTGVVTTMLPNATAPHSLAISPDGLTVAGSWYGAVGILDANGELQQEIPHGRGNVRLAFLDMAFTPDGLHIVGAADNVAWVSPELGEIVLERGDPSMRSRYLSVLNNDIVVVDRNPEVQVVSARDETPLCQMKVENPGDVAVSPDGKRFATARYDAGFTVWNVDDCSIASEWSAEGYTPSIEWHADNRHLVTGSNSGVVNFWDTETGELAHSLDAHGEGLVLIAMTPDARTLVSIGQSGEPSVKLWGAQ